MEGANNYDNKDLRTVSDIKLGNALRSRQLPECFQTLKAPDETDFEPYVLMLMGLPGSGKSTIADKLQELEPWKYVRVNQDTLGDRHACLKLAEQVLSERKCPVIDRCHASFKNRKPFHQLAKSLDVSVDILIVDAPFSICLERCQLRQDHPTVSLAEASRILGCVRKEWKLPGKNENARQTWTISGIEDPRFPQLCRQLL